MCKKHGKCEHSLSKGGRYRCRRCTVEAVTTHRRRLKHKAVAYLGGKCSICGYNKCIDALEFHHKNPAEKTFGIASSGITYSWARVKVELDKCILVCANCHRELHHRPSDNTKFEVKNKINFCKICGKPTKNKYYCSDFCAKFARRKVVRPSPETLSFDLKHMSYCAVGRKYGVSDKTVRKWEQYYRTHKF